jgi:hypothetical protein
MTAAQNPTLMISNAKKPTAFIGPETTLGWAWAR